RDAATVFEVERRLRGLADLRDLLLEALDAGDDRAVDARGVWPVDLDQVSSRVAQIHLHPPARVLADRRALRLEVERPQLLRFQVDALEVVDVQREMVEPGRVRIAKEEVKLVLAEAQPLHRAVE